MKCQWISERVSAYLDGELTGKDGGLFEEHVRSCDSCRVLVEEVRRTSRILRSQPRLEPSERFDLELGVALRGIRRREESVSGFWGRLWRPVAVPQLLVAAAAFVLVVVIGGSLLGPYLGGGKGVVPSGRMMAETTGETDSPASAGYGLPESLSIAADYLNRPEVEYVLDEVVLPQSPRAAEVRPVSARKGAGKASITF